ncbi:Hsp33 family molecular chaperone [Devosia sp.]|uniref:Hsp33 family molecular chaperone n=1 Tax=Devosia sp. TaxID=1871048 RepID=UPI003A8CB697
MAETQLSTLGLDRPESGDDVVVPFTLDTLDARGRIVRLGDALDAILTRHNYPEPVARLLGEAVVLAALMGSSLKFAGKFIMQTQTDGPVNLMVVDFDAPDGLRGYARFDADAVQKLVDAGQAQSGKLLGNGHLAMTVDQGAHMERYQGIVALEGGTLEDVAHGYFQQSEQIPTLVRLAVAQFSKKGDSRAHWRAGGSLVQFLPAHGQSMMPDLPGDGNFDNPETADPDFVEDDKWTTTRSLFSTVADDELADPDLSAERLLYRLFHETGVRIFDPIELVERCSCSAERIDAMLRDNFTAEERAEMTVDGKIEVVCEFCSAEYHFHPREFGDDEPAADTKH